MDDTTVLPRYRPYFYIRSLILNCVQNKKVGKRITNIFEAAIENDIGALILGAFGCGTFRNDPNLVASTFGYVLEKPRYKYAFKNISFAIMRSDTPCPNLTAFSQVIGNIR